MNVQKNHNDSSTETMETVNHLRIQSQTNSIKRKLDQSNSTTSFDKKIDDSSVMKIEYKRKSKKRSVKKPEGRPRRPLCAYNIFFQYERQQILLSTPSSSPHMISGRASSKQKRKVRRGRKTHGKITFAELGKRIGAKWKNLDATARKGFESLAAVDKQRYKKEIDDWNRNRTAQEKLENETICQSRKSNFPHIPCSDSVHKTSSMKQNLENSDGNFVAKDTLMKSKLGLNSWEPLPLDFVPPDSNGIQNPEPVNKNEEKYENPETDHDDDSLTNGSSAQKAAARMMKISSDPVLDASVVTSTQHEMNLVSQAGLGPGGVIPSSQGCIERALYEEFLTFLAELEPECDDDGMSLNEQHEMNVIARSSLGLEVITHGFEDLNDAAFSEDFLIFLKEFESETPQQVSRE